MSSEKGYKLPDPIVDNREAKLLVELTKRYEHMIRPSALKKAAGAARGAIENAASLLPSPVKEIGGAIGENVGNVVDGAKEAITQAEVYQEALKRVGEAMQIVQAQSAKFTINSDAIIKAAQAHDPNNDITSINELCLLRAYDLGADAAMFRTVNLGAALAEGGGTGFLGFKGIPLSLVLSTFMCFRVVQSVAMRYGFDVQHDDQELIISATVFANGLSPRDGGEASELGGVVAKVMLISELKGVEQAASKQWSAVIAQGGLGLLIAQMRGLANKAAANALEKAGQKSLEESVFKGVFEQVGKSLTLKNVGRAVPVASAVVGAAFDVTTMNQVIDYAEIFYQKRFIAEKADNIARLLS